MGSHGHRLHRATLAAVLLGFVITGLLSAGAQVNYLNSERNLTRLQTQLTASALAVAPTDVGRRLGPAVQAAADGDGPVEVSNLLKPSLEPRGSYISVEVVRMSAAGPHVFLRQGASPLAGPKTPWRQELHRAESHDGLVLNRLTVRGEPQRLAYALAARGRAGTYVVYAEQVIPTYLSLPATVADGEMNFALYLGLHPAPAQLLMANTHHLPLGGTAASGTVAFGDRVLTLVMSPKVSLSGALAEYLAWAIGVAGGVASLIAGGSVERLLRRREGADARAEVAEDDLRKQRAVAEKLQKSLLPAQLPSLSGLEVAVRYLPGTEGIDVGGDWYDVVDVEPHVAFFTVGDVVGRGLDAATTMASLRHAINAHASGGAWPHEALERVGRLLDVAGTGRFATVVCGRLDLRTGHLVAASAGHPAPIAVEAGSARFLDLEPGAPVGVGKSFPLGEWYLAPGTTLLLYTDGLVERRHEDLGVGLERLRMAVAADLPPAPLLDRLISTLVHEGTADDVAVMALRWVGAQGV